jgi:Co/Zn/Cd efflux system component
MSVKSLFKKYSDEPHEKLIIGLVVTIFIGLIVNVVGGFILNRIEDKRRKNLV